MGAKTPLCVGVSLLAAAASSARADEPTGDGVSALPGLVRVGVAEPLAPGWSVATAADYGFTESVLESSDSHHRVGTTLAATYRPRAWFGAGVQLDGRYDKHLRAPEGKDDGWIGVPRLVARAGRGGLAGELAVWFPHDGSFGVSGDGVSVDARGIASRRFGALVATATAGARLDRSAATAADADMLSLADRMALGVSDANAVLLGAGAAWRRGRSQLFGEWSWDLLVGGDAPPPSRSPMRATVGGRWQVGAQSTIGAALDVTLSARPDVARGEPLVPVEPRVRVLAAWTVAFGGPRALARIAADVDRIADAEPPPPESKTGVVRGVLRAPDGAPAPAVRILVTAGDKTVEAFSDMDGSFEVADLPYGPAVVEVPEQPPLAAWRTTVEVGAEAPPVEVALARVLPAGQIRGQVRSNGGVPLAAVVRVEGLDVSTQTAPDGTFAMDVAPGKYTVVIEAQDWTAQRRKIAVEEEGVTILNVELQPRKP